MGQQYSAPVPGTKLQVIGAGLSRTGTASFSRALEILLDGPVYHGGTNVTLGPEREIKSWIKFLRRWLEAYNNNGSYKSKKEEEDTMRLLAERVDGYVAVTDAPFTSALPELIKLYPDAKVIVTVRDAEAWEKSMVTVSNAATIWFLKFALFPLPTLRYFVDYIDVLRDVWWNLYGETEPPTRVTYNRHIELLKRTVPEDRLFFVSVKDGWEPLCKALGKEIPSVPFPRINDGEAIDAFAKKHVGRGLIRWVWILSGVAVAGGVAFLQWRDGGLSSVSRFWSS